MLNVSLQPGDSLFVDVGTFYMYENVNVTSEVVNDENELFEFRIYPDLQYTVQRGMCSLIYPGSFSSYYFVH